MAQQLSALAAISEDKGSVTDDLFWPLEAPGMHVKNMQALTYNHKIKISLKKKDQCTRQIQFPGTHSGQTTGVCDYHLLVLERGAVHSGV